MSRGQKLTSEKEQFYIQRIAELEKQVAELLKINAALPNIGNTRI
jgi:hypothetical protein